MIEKFRKRLCEENYLETTFTHFLTGNRLNENHPGALKSQVGDKIKIVIIDELGFPPLNIPPKLSDQNYTIQKITKLYTKQFKDLNNKDFENASPTQNNSENLATYLSLIYNKKVSEIINGEVTIIKTEPCD